MKTVYDLSKHALYVTLCAFLPHSTNIFVDVKVLMEVILGTLLAVMMLCGCLRLGSVVVRRRGNQRGSFEMDKIWSDGR
jgi:hypothetical protein